MVMKCEAIVKKILKKTSAKGFKEFKVGDEVEFSNELKACGRGRGTYATYIEIHNKTQDIKVCKSFNELSMLLSCFEWEERERAL